MDLTRVQDHIKQYILRVVSRFMSVQVVWFKRDLRLSDHAAISAAARRDEPVIFLYVFDDFLLSDARYSERHFLFISQCLEELRAELHQRGHKLHVLKGNALHIFRHLHEKFTIGAVLSHEEVGTVNTWQRDRALKTYFASKHIIWQEFPNNGIIRRMRETEIWHAQWHETMAHAQEEVSFNKMQVFRGEIKTLDLPQKKGGAFQTGGSFEARNVLNSFLKERHRQYFRHISRPHESTFSCSRMSPYLAWGAISMRQVVQATRQAMRETGPNIHLKQFLSRLHWQGHFIQKFERETRMEYENINPAFNQVRNEINEAFIRAWKTGETGYPLVDASMRCLQSGGWINFRMRAMLVSFLTHHLWQPWQAGASHLASLFLDFEPGIHYPQIQMQAGTTGTHILRVYDPVKQGLEKDSEALFIKKWCPELADIPAPIVHAPWELSAMEQAFYNFSPGKTYPNRIVKTSETGLFAQKTLWPIIKSRECKDFAAMYLKRHVTSPERKRKQSMQ